MAPRPPGLLIAAPASGSGKTTLALGLLRALKKSGVAVAPVKVGPDYVDPAFHAAASGRPCLNLDAWAMRPDTLKSLLSRHSETADLILGEGVMGLFDGARGGVGSTAHMARLTGWPVVLVVDVRGQAASAAATVHGFTAWDDAVSIGGAIYNRVGGEGHAALLRAASTRLNMPVLGCLPHNPGLFAPSRHLGLVQAAEHADLDAFIEQAAAFVTAHVDITAVAALARPSTLGAPSSTASPRQGIRPLGQRIAVAHDVAFAFAYPFLLDNWRRQGAEILPFSPLANEAPPLQADSVYLPGGYPELHAAPLAHADLFQAGMKQAAAAGIPIYGECGGYMTLGQGIVDAQGNRHAMLGLLPLETSMLPSARTLGYRQATLALDCPLGTRGQAFRGHVFHAAAVLAGDGEAPLWHARSASGTDCGPIGAQKNSVFGSFLHLIDEAAPTEERLSGADPAPEPPESASKPKDD